MWFFYCVEMYQSRIRELYEFQYEHKKDITIIVHDMNKHTDLAVPETDI